jgi:hypothetical protein
MAVRIINRRLTPRDVVVKLVDGSMVKGKVNLHHDEEIIQRVSELFTRVKDPFIVVFDALLEGKSQEVMVINKNQIVWISPEDQQEEQGSTGF